MPRSLDEEGFLAWALVSSGKAERQVSLNLAFEVISVVPEVKPAHDPGPYTIVNLISDITVMCTNVMCFSEKLGGLHL